MIHTLGNIENDIKIGNVNNKEINVKSCVDNRCNCFIKKNINDFCFACKRNYENEKTKNMLKEMFKGQEIETFTKGKLTEKMLLDCDLYKIKELLEKLDIKLIENNDLDETIKGAYLWQYQKNCILDCAMYRIIERGGIRIGSRRGLLFALESDGDINVPMKYCVDYSDPGLREFINTYLKAGGSKELECYENYFTRTSDNEALTTITIRDLLLKQKNNEKSFFTKKEDESHQNLVNTLAKIRKKTLHKKKTLQ